METELELAAAFIDGHTDEAALALERQPVTDATALLAELPPETAGRALSRAAVYFGVECLKGLPKEAAGGIIGAMPLDSAAMLLRRLSPSDRSRLLESAPSKTASGLSLLLRFPENTAGALMDPEVLSVPDDLTAEETLHRVRHSGVRISYYAYIVTRGGELCGVLSLRELMAAEPDAPVELAMRRQVSRIGVHADRIAIRAHPGWLEFYALPVVDDANRLVGVLRYRTIRSVEDASPQENRDPIAVGLALGEVYWSTMSQLVQSLWPGAPTRQESKPEDTHDE